MKQVNAFSWLFLLAPGFALSATPAPAGRISEERGSVLDAEEKRRVLALASGQKIRVVSRFADGRWEYRAKNGWKALEHGAVTSAVLESQLLLEWNTRREKTDPRDVASRTLLAGWAAGAGLATEALGEIEAVLALEPDAAGAREVLAGYWFFTVPSLAREGQELTALEEELFRFGAGQTAAGRELAVLEFARHPDRAALHARLVRELASKIVVRRSFAALALRRLFAGDDAKLLMVRSVFDASSDVRKHCALGLKAAGEPALCVPIVKALDSRSAVVRANAAEALGHMGYAAAVEPLVATLAALQGGGGGGGAERLPHSYIFVGEQTAYVQDFDVEVAQFQAVADPVINVVLQGSVLETAVIGETVETVSELSQVVQRSLASLTGEMPGHSAKAWLSWWEKNGAHWRSDERSRPETG